MFTRRLLLVAYFLPLFFGTARAGTYLVTSTSASGSSSLRAAIDSVNTHPGPDSIHFNIPGPAPHKIAMVCADPYIINDDDTVLDGYSQPGSAINTAKGGNPFNGVITIQIGALFGLPCFQDAALTINGARNVVRGIRIDTFFKYGIVVNGDDAVIDGCRLFEMMYGIDVRPSSGVRIGGNTPALRNLILDNYYGINVGGESGDHVLDLSIQGNEISSSGSNPGWNAVGVFVHGYTTGVMVGGHLTGSCGLNGAMNVVTYHQQHGVAVDGDEVTGVSVLSNLIHSNQGLAIDLDYDGVAANDPGDADDGPNHRQNYPRLVSSDGNSIFGVLESAPNRAFTILVFDNHSSPCDPSGHGEGKLAYGETQVITDHLGYANFTVSCGAVVAGHYYTATATDEEGNTSEFSECFEPTVTAVPGAPGTFALHANVPNPFNPATTVSFEMGAAGPVDIVIFDIAGRRVRALVSEYREAGPGTAEWDGRDDIGEPAASGVYFCRMSAGNFSASRKIVLLK